MHHSILYIGNQVAGTILSTRLPKRYPLKIASTLVEQAAHIRNGTFTHQALVIDLDELKKRGLDAAEQLRDFRHCTRQSSRSRKPRKLPHLFLLGKNQKAALELADQIDGTTALTGQIGPEPLTAALDTHFGQAHSHGFVRAAGSDALSAATT